MSLEFPATGELSSGELEPVALLDMQLRVWAEIGRARMPAAYVVGMPKGSIVDLDCGPDEPADLFVNGRHFGTGRLVLVDGEWALRVETLDEDVDPDLEQVSSPDSDAAEAVE
ncbi:MAG: flagellar motor switch protein FliN [Thermoleophilaceae bacterium]|jgi:flagellar motor switch protein FliN/FliY|nr:flagellar motor switch protein FliN [Thermoleophilaceae bacterium]